jgi:hypothetical protein
MLCSVVPLPKNAHAQSNPFWWHSLLTQDGRNDRIVSFSNRWSNGSYGGQCKVWVQNVVSQCSSGIVWLPLNDPNCDWRWQWSADVSILSSDRRIMLRPGHIIQAQIRTRTGALSPHTLIVTNKSGDFVSVVESNWRGDERIGRRTLSSAELWASLVHFTVYEVR